MRAPLHNHGTAQCEMSRKRSNHVVTTSLLQLGGACVQPKCAMSGVEGNGTASDCKIWGLVCLGERCWERGFANETPKCTNLAHSVQGRRVTAVGFGFANATIRDSLMRHFHSMAHWKFRSIRAGTDRSYNVGVSNSSAKRSSDKTADQAAKLRRSAFQQYKMEATGIIIIAMLILAITLARYWHGISWSLR